MGTAEKMEWCNVMGHAASENVRRSLRSAIEGDPNSTPTPSVFRKEKPSMPLMPQLPRGTRVLTPCNGRSSQAGGSRRLTEVLSGARTTRQTFTRAMTDNNLPNMACKGPPSELDLGEKGPRNSDPTSSAEDCFGDEILNLKPSRLLVGDIHDIPASDFKAPAEGLQAPRQSILEEPAMRTQSSDSVYHSFGGVPIDQLVHSTPLFRDCSHEFIETVLLSIKKKMVRPGQFLVEEGATTPQAVFFIVWGSLTITSMGLDTGASVQEGKSIGEDMILCVSSGWRCGLRADPDKQCIVCELTRRSLEETLLEFPEEKDQFLKIYDQHIRLVEAQDSGEQWKVLQRCAALSCCSDDMLQAVDKHLIRRMYFPDEEVFAEKDKEGNLYVLEQGSVTVAIADRLIRYEEVPYLCNKLVYGEEIVPQMPPNVAKMGAETSDDALLAIRAAPDSPWGSVIKEDAGDTWDDPKANAMGFTTPDVPAATIFGEEVLLRLSPCMTKTVRTKTLCNIRILYRTTFLALLETRPHDRERLKPWLYSRRTAEDDFPLKAVLNSHPFSSSTCSKEFYSFLLNHVEERMFGPQEIVSLDEFHKYIHHITPAANISVCRVNRGKIRVAERNPQFGMKMEVKATVSFMEASDEEDEEEEDDEGESRKHTKEQAEVKNEEFLSLQELTAGGLIPGEHFWQRKLVQSMEVSFVSILHRGVVARAMEEHANDREVIVPLLGQQAQLQQQKSDKVARILRERSIFANTSKEFIKEIIGCGVTRVFMPGDRIIEQGSDGTSMFILWLGISSVVTEQLEEDDGNCVRTLTSVGALPVGSVFGELVMLGVHQRRTASIIAATVCCTWEVEHKHCLNILDRHPVERANFLKLVQEHLDRLAAPRIIYHPLFAAFHQQFRTLLGVYCEKKLYFPGETIVAEGSTGDKLYIMNLGTASIQIHQQHVMQIAGGSHFGFSVMCGTQERYAAAVVAESMCQVLAVSTSTYRHALNKYPDMVDAARAVEADEKAKQLRQRAIFARMVRRRRGLKCIIEALRQSNAAMVADRNYLELSFEAWRNIMIRTAESRREAEEVRIANARRIEQWLAKRQRQMKNVKPRKDLKRLVDYNLSRRGPLKLAKKAPCSMSPRRPLSDSWEETESPYLSPSPFLRRGALTARQSRRLPPLSMSANTRSENGVSAASNESSKFGASRDRATSAGWPMNMEPLPVSSSPPPPNAIVSDRVRDEYSDAEEESPRHDVEPFFEDKELKRSFLCAAGPAFETAQDLFDRRDTIESNLPGPPRSPRRGSLSDCF